MPINLEFALNAGKTFAAELYKTGCIFYVHADVPEFANNELKSHYDNLFADNQALIERAFKIGFNAFFPHYSSN